MKRLSLLALVFVLLFAVVPAFAQEITPTVTPPISEDPPVIVVPVPTETSPLGSSIITLILIGSSVVALVMGVIAYRRANPNASGADWDAALTELVEQRKANRELITRYENIVQGLRDSQADSARVAITALTTSNEVLKFVKNLTSGIKLDDAASDLLDDILTPGAPVDPTQNPQG